MNHILNFDEQGKRELEILFKKIYDGNIILFLGAGASLTDEHNYLSEHLIELYEAEINKQIGTKDITEFIDVLSKTSGFSRHHFDEFVFDLLKKLNPSKEHKILARIPWREIITTNMDILVERAYDDIINTSDYEWELVKTKSKKEYNAYLAKNQIRLVKLHGCISDRKKYPFCFSSEDFDGIKSYYKLVLNSLKNISHNVEFMSIGYSYSDHFSKKLLVDFDKYDFRGRRWFHHIEPTLSIDRLEYYSSNQIRVINSTFKEFFQLYDDWETSTYKQIVKSKGIYFHDRNNSPIKIKPKSLIKLTSNVIQLEDTGRYSYIKPVEFYKGEEPNYGVVTKNYDVIREELLTYVENEIKSYISNLTSNLVPLVLLKGSFGTGKSTFTYRLIDYMKQNMYSDSLAFEVVDPVHLDIKDLKELLSEIKEKEIILFFNFIERDQFFKLLLEMRIKLSKEQLMEKRILLIASIRENLLEKYKNGRDIPLELELNIDRPLNDHEIIDLLEKLKNAGLVNYRDTSERQKLLNKIKKEYNGDSYVTLLNLVNGNHFKDLIEAYNSLAELGKKALLYTALLHKLNILMPIGLLRELISDDWEKFRNEFLEIDCKGILIQEVRDFYGLHTDVFFRTKHPLIAEKLIETFMQNKDDQYYEYENILTRITYSESNSRLVNDILRYFRINETFNTARIEVLYDKVYSNLEDDPYFLLIYSINLQNRKDLKSLEKALQLIIYAEGLLDYRNHRFIHRKAVILFEIAKVYYSQEKNQLIMTNKYLSEAESFFEIKLIMDPCSSYSYENYIELVLWRITRIKLEESDFLRQKIKIEEMFDVAEKTIVDNLNRVIDLKKRYIKEYLSDGSKEKYLELLDKYYDNEKTRPLALILKYNFYILIEQEDTAQSLLGEIEYYKENNEVGKFLFKYYGRNIHKQENRLKLFEIVRIHSEIESTDSLRYNYFMYVANDYNQLFTDAKSYIDNINQKYETLQPDYSMVWKEEDSTNRIFEGIITTNKWKRLVIYIPILQKSFRIKRKSSNHLADGIKVNCLLYFYLNGICAEIIKND